MKDDARESRGQGIRKRVVSTSSIPSNWHSFLRSNENKAELFLFLAHQIKDINIQGKQIISTAEEDVVSSSPIDTTGLAPCSHEEADTRLLLHVAQGIRCGFDKVIIRTVDTDVVILSIANFHQLCPTELWISFGAGKHHRYIPAHQIAVNLGEEKCRALTFFHAFTGCDTVSVFSGKGKKSAFDLWNICPSVTAIFGLLSSMPYELRQEHLETIERFVILWYDRTSRLSSINDCRRSLFSKGLNLENIPPTQDALEQHALRATY